MDKVDYLVNFVNEYLAGKDVDSIQPKLFQVLLQMSKKTLLELDTLHKSLFRSIPHRNDMFIDFMRTVNESEGSWKGVHNSLSDLEERTEREKAKISDVHGEEEELWSRNNSNLSLQDNFANLKYLAIKLDTLKNIYVSCSAEFEALSTAEQENHFVESQLEGESLEKVTSFMANIRRLIKGLK
jgi:hypothetical protein